MFSPLENEELDRWFQRLDAPLKRLPANERAEVHQEVRQHLEALAAANEELGSTPEEAWQLALTLFGEPGSFGKKMVQEWQQGKPDFRADMAAILTVFGLDVLGFVGSWLTSSLAGSWVNHHGHPVVLAITNDVSIYVVPIAIAVLMGRLFPFQALKGVFYVRNSFLLCWWLFLGVHACFHPSVSHPTLLAMAAYGLLWTPVSLIIPYLASVTKRGWYKPRLNDFKLTLPKRQIAE